MTASAIEHSLSEGLDLVDQDPVSVRVILLRHAETSAPDLFHGAESDISLSARGLEQAVAVARRLVRFEPAALYCSGMRRARETASPIGQACGLEPIIVPKLHERVMGCLSRAPRSEVQHIVEAEYERWGRGELDYSHPGGESYAQIRDRVVPAFLGCVSRQHRDTIVVVAHGVVIRVLLTSLVEGRSHVDVAKIPIDFVGLHGLQFDGGTWRDLSIPS